MAVLWHGRGPLRVSRVPVPSPLKAAALTEHNLFEGDREERFGGERESREAWVSERGWGGRRTWVGRGGHGWSGVEWEVGWGRGVGSF